MRHAAGRVLGVVHRDVGAAQQGRAVVAVRRAPAPRRRSLERRCVSPASGYGVGQRLAQLSAASSAASLAPGTRAAHRELVRRRAGPPRAVRRSASLSRWPTWTSSWSPQVCPSESLTSLNRSRSSWTRATTPSSAEASSIAASRCWPSRARVGSPVSRSWYAACRSRATRSWFSIAAVSRVARRVRDLHVLRGVPGHRALPIGELEMPERVRTGAQRDGDDLPGAASGQGGLRLAAGEQDTRPAAHGPGRRSGRPAPAEAASTLARPRPP